MTEIIRSWEPDICNVGRGSLLDELRVRYGLPEPERRWEFPSPFDSTSTWNCANPVTTRLVIPAALYGPFDVCRLHRATMVADARRGPARQFPGATWLTLCTATACRVVPRSGRYCDPHRVDHAGDLAGQAHAAVAAFNQRTTRERP